jgi:hypothetical protein
MSTKNSCCQNPDAGTIETVNEKNLPAGPTENDVMSRLLALEKKTSQLIPKTWQERVDELESMGMTTSDAQGAIDVEIMEGWRPSDFQPWMLVPMMTTKSYDPYEPREYNDAEGVTTMGDLG